MNNYLCPNCGHSFQQGEFEYNYETVYLDFECPFCGWYGNDNNVFDSDNFVNTFYVVSIDLNGSGADNIAYNKVELEQVIRDYRIAHSDSIISVKQIMLDKPLYKDNIEDSFFDGFIENYTEIPIVHQLLCYGIIRHKTHELMCNSIETPTEFYHFNKGELMYKSKNIVDVIKSIENQSGDIINGALKTHLTFNFR